MPTIKATEQKLLSFAKLPKGWHYGEGVPLTERCMGIAEAILDRLALMGFMETNVFPGDKGDVEVTAYDGADIYEYFVELDGTVTVIHDRNNEEVSYDERLSLTTTLKKIKDFAFEQCDYSDSSTQISLTPPRAGSNQLHSGIPQMVAGSLSLILIAPSPPQEIFASISPVITQIPRDLPSFSGKFQIA